MQSSSEIVTINKPTPNFLQAGCPFCRPTNSVKALRETQTQSSLTHIIKVLQLLTHISSLSSNEITLLILAVNTYQFIKLQ